jgi:hypothetical protein
MQIADIKNAVDTFVADNKDKLKNRQDQFKAKHGRFWQGPMTHTVTPDDGAVTAPDLTIKANGYISTWGHVLKGANAWPAIWPCACVVNVYVSPLGHGWTLTTLVTKNGKTHARVRDFGPANGDANWSQAPDPVVITPPVEDPDLP